MLRFELRLMKNLLMRSCHFSLIRLKKRRRPERFGLNNMVYKCSFYCGQQRSVMMRDYEVQASNPFDASRIVESLYASDKYFRWSSIPQPK